MNGFTSSFDSVQNQESYIIYRTVYDFLIRINNTKTSISSPVIADLNLPPARSPARIALALSTKPSYM